MKIRHPADTPAPVKTGTGPNATNSPLPQVNTSAIPAKADDSAKIQLSNTASALLTGGSTPEFDAAKVDSISKSIDNGTFKINPGAIADKLIANAHELLGKVKS